MKNYDWDYNSFFQVPLFQNIKLDEKKINFVGITYFWYGPSSIKERKKNKRIRKKFNIFKNFLIL